MSDNHKHIAALKSRQDYLAQRLSGALPVQNEIFLSVFREEKEALDWILSRVEQVDVMHPRPEVNRVELIDKLGRRYVNMNCTEVQTCLQDEGKTLKVFLV